MPTYFIDILFIDVRSIPSCQQCTITLKKATVKSNPQLFFLYFYPLISGEIGIGHTTAGNHKQESFNQSNSRKKTTPAVIDL